MQDFQIIFRHNNIKTIRKKEKALKKNIVAFLLPRIGVWYYGHWSSGRKLSSQFQLRGLWALGLMYMVSSEIGFFSSISGGSQGKQQQLVMFGESLRQP